MRIFLLFLVLLISCDPQPIIASIEVATKTVDRSLDNTVRVNSVVELGNEVYFGSIVLRILQGEEWEVVGSPAGSENPIIDLVASDNKLWMATNKAILQRDGQSWKNTKSFSDSFFGRVFFTANSETFAYVDNALYHYEKTKNEWEKLFDERPGSIIFQSSTYYFLTAKKIYTRDVNLGTPGSIQQFNNLGENVTLSMSDLVYYKNQFYLANNDTVYRSNDITASSTWETLDGFRVRWLTLVDDVLLGYGGFFGYGVWDGTRWLTNKGSDNFTNVDSLLVNIGDTPVHQQPLAKMTYLNTSRHLYAIPFGAQGLFSATKDGQLWKWTRE